MSLVGFKARNHRQQVLIRGVRPEVDDRATTLEVFAPLDERFSFTVDVAASARNRKMGRFYTVEDDGLAQSWKGERVWCNPPYSNIGEWVEKAWAETDAELVVMLLPANRTEQGWWQEMVEPFRDRASSPLTTEFIPGRLRFIAHDRDHVEPNERPPLRMRAAHLELCRAKGGHGMRTLIRIVERALGRRTCRGCGCTDHAACAGGCWWVESDLCSACDWDDFA